MCQIVHDADSIYAIGVDIGGTKINAGLIRENGEIVWNCSVETLAGQANPADRAIDAITNVLKFLNHSGIEPRLKGIGVGSSGQIEWRTGNIRFGTELIPGYVGTPLKQMLEDAFGLPVLVDNDVNVLCLTEKVLGTGRGVNHLLCLALGTGVGGALMIDGRIYHGAWGGAAEAGHMSVDYKGLPCLCGGAGCLEQYASGTGIAARMRRRLSEQGVPDETITARDVMALWQAGDGIATEIMDETFAALGTALASLIHLFNPEVVIIGGGVAEAGERFISRVREEVHRRTMRSYLERLRIEPAFQGNLSGMIGAALQMWEYDICGHRKM